MILSWHSVGVNKVCSVFVKRSYDRTGVSVPSWLNDHSTELVYNSMRMDMKWNKNEMLTNRYKALSRFQALRVYKRSIYCFLQCFCLLTFGWPFCPSSNTNGQTLSLNAWIFVWCLTVIIGPALMLLSSWGNCLWQHLRRDQVAGEMCWTGIKFPPNSVKCWFEQQLSSKTRAIGAWTMYGMVTVLAKMDFSDTLARKPKTVVANLQ